MVSRNVTTLFAFCLLTTWNLSASAQTLQRIREEVRVVEPSVTIDSPNESTNRRERDYPDTEVPRSSLRDDGDSLIESMTEGLVKSVITSPFWVPRAVAQEVDYRNGYFLEYPFQDEWGGLVETQLSDSIWSDSLLRLRIDGGTNLNDLSLAGGQILLDMPWRLGIDSEFAYRYEDIADFKDELWTGDLNFTYRFAQSHRLQMRSGIGLNYLVDDVESDFGFNITYSGDVFLKPPFIFSFETDAGTLGDSALFHGRATVGACKGHTEVFTGYDYYRVGETEIQSWVAGLRFWF